MTHSLTYMYKYLTKNQVSSCPTDGQVYLAEPRQLCTKLNQATVESCASGKARTPVQYALRLQAVQSNSWNLS